MGNKQCSCKKRADDAVIPGVVNITQRENMATWHRVDIPLTDVYEIMDTIGPGQMGEVLKVRRKVENRGLHNADTREKKSLMKDLDSSDQDHRSVNSFGSRSSNPFMSRNQIRKQKQRNEEILKKFVVNTQHEDQPSTNNKPTPSIVKPKSILKKPLKDRMPSTGENNEVSAHSDEIGKDQSKAENHHVLHPHFSDTEFESCNPSVASENDVSVLDGSGVEMELDRESLFAMNPEKSKEIKDKRWVPRRKIRFQRLYACKTIATEKIKGDQMKDLLNEIYIMRKMDHPYIVRLYEVYQANKKIWLVMDLCTGGNLTTRKLKEPEVTVITEQILRGVAYLHKRGICHRNLKLENILFENSSANSSIRLIDFGLSQTYSLNPRRKHGNGAAYCMSPEVAGELASYSEKCDVWSIGIIVWILLAGDYPFLKNDEDLNDEQKKAKLVNGSFKFGITWRGRGITEFAKTFVKGCLKKDPQERWSAIEALEFLQDEWIPALEAKCAKEAEYEAIRLKALPQPVTTKKHSVLIKTKEVTSVLEKTHSSKSRKEQNILDYDIMEDIVRFTKFGLLKKTALVALANRLDRTDIGMLSELFLLVDTNQTGTISPDELKEALEKLKMPNMNEELMESIFAGIDHDQSGQIHYAEFLAALSEGAGLVTHERVADVFDRIDSEGKGFISHEDLKNILGENYEEEKANKMINEGDFKKNGRVDYDEFVQLMFEKL